MLGHNKLLNKLNIQDIVMENTSGDALIDGEADRESLLVLILTFTKFLRRLEGEMSILKAS